MIDPQRADQTLLLNAALDGELDAVGMIEIEAKLAADPALRAEYARLVALRDAIMARVPRQSPPEALLARGIAMAQAPSRVQPPAPPHLRLLRPRDRSLPASLKLAA